MARKYQKASVKYQRTAKEYAEVYGVSEITVKRWKKAGWPLDDEAATRALREGQKEKTLVAPCLVAVDAALGISAATERLREAEAAAHAAYLQASPEDASKLLSTWLKLQDALRKSEESAPDIEESNKNTVQLGELKNALNDLFRKLRQDLETLARRTALELVGKDEIGIREILDREAEEIIKNLYTCRYLGAEDEG